jgi:hypothetical protein
MKEGKRKKVKKKGKTGVWGGDSWRVRELANPV